MNSQLQSPNPVVQAAFTIQLVQLLQFTHNCFPNDWYQLIGDVVPTIRLSTYESSYKHLSPLVEALKLLGWYPLHWNRKEGNEWPYKGKYWSLTLLRNSSQK